ncbi:MAG: histidine phosphatase family protein [Dehalococcoidia bacterium]
MSHPRLVVIVRHGQSEHHVRKLTGGWTDTSLTALGHEQARRVATRLKDELGDREITLYTSDLLRAGETARHIAGVFGVEPVIDDRLREHNNGEAANLTWEDAHARFPDALSASIWSHDNPPWPGAETGREFYARSASFLDSLRTEGPIPVVVTHGGTIMCLVARWLLIEPSAIAPIGFSAYTTAITVLTGDPFREVERLNDVAHLAGMTGWVPIGDLAS